jgi:hypothetical protein
MPDKQIERPAIDQEARPNLPRWLFWEWIYEKMEWQDGYWTVIERVLDRGDTEELDELVRFYGREKVLQVLTKEPIYLMDHSIEKVCAYFHLQKDDLHCYHRKKQRGGGWL